MIINCRCSPFEFFFSVSVFFFGDRFPFEWVSIVNSLAKYEPRVVMSILFLHGLWWGGEKKRQRSFLLTLTRTFFLSRFSLMVAASLGSSFLSFPNSLYFFFSFAHLVKSNYIGIFFVLVRFFTFFYSFFCLFLSLYLRHSFLHHRYWWPFFSLQVVRPLASIERSN